MRCHGIETCADSRFLLGLLLAACASDPTGGKPPVITKSVNDHLQAFLRENQQGRGGAFAVSANGQAAFYSVCESGGCNGQYDFGHKAVQGCEKFGEGRCVVLASNGLIKRPYSVGAN